MVSSSASQRALKGLETRLQELHSGGDFTGCNREDGSSHDGGLTFALGGDLRDATGASSSTFSSQTTSLVGNKSS